MIVITSMNELPRSCMTCPFQKNKKTPFCRAKRNWYRPFENIPPSFGFYIRDDAFLKGQTPWNARAKWCPLIEVADRKTEPQYSEDDMYWLSLAEDVANGKMSDAGANQAWLEYINRKTEPTISKMEQVDKDEPQICEWCKFYDGEKCFSQEPCKVMLYLKTEPQTEVKRGCTHCSTKDDCPDAYTEVSQYCGGYEQTDCAWK